MATYKSFIVLVWLFGSVVCSCASVGNRDQRDYVTRQRVIDTLEHYLFIKEVTGHNDGYWVEKVLKSVGAKKGDPWCGAFQGFVFLQCGLRIPKYAARAAAWFDQEHTIPNKDAIPGDLASFYYQRLGRIGHIGMYLIAYVNKTPYVVTGEGNTNDRQSREGNRAAKVYRPRGVIYSSANWIDIKNQIK